MKICGWIFSSIMLVVLCGALFFLYGVHEVNKTFPSSSDLVFFPVTVDHFSDENGDTVLYASNTPHAQFTFFFHPHFLATAHPLINPQDNVELSITKADFENLSHKSDNGIIYIYGAKSPDGKILIDPDTVIKNLHSMVNERYGYLCIIMDVAIFYFVVLLGYISWQWRNR
jgi:hypothetical protein